MGHQLSFRWVDKRTKARDYYDGHTTKIRRQAISRNKKRKEKQTIGEWLLAKVRKKNTTPGITAGFFDALFAQQCGRCFYTGVELVDDRHNNNALSPSVDRIDSNRGYEPDNVCIAAWFVNRAKSNLASQNFLTLFAELARGAIKKWDL